MEWIFKLIHWRHFKDRNISIIKITGLRSALVDIMGQRKRVKFYFKLGKHYF